MNNMIIVESYVLTKNTSICINRQKRFLRLLFNGFSVECLLCLFS